MLTLVEISLLDADLGRLEEEGTERSDAVDDADAGIDNEFDLDVSDCAE